MGQTLTEALPPILRALRPATQLAVGPDGNPAGGAGTAHPAAPAAPAPAAPEDNGAATARELQRAELTLCPDALLDVADAAARADLVAWLLRSATRALVVAGRERAGDGACSGTRFHEPLSATIRRLDPAAEIYPLAEEAGVATLLVLKPPPERHHDDFRAAMLDPLVGRHPHPRRLAEIRLTAWNTTGFYPNHAPRLWEYPVVADLVCDLLPPGSRVVDVGAGVTPLAPYLATLGYQVETVDPSPVRRTWPPRPDWNEWDFLDYAAAGLAHRSWNCTLDRLPWRRAFDAICSVSVIEHLTAAERRALLAEIRHRLRPGGAAVLTVDLFRGRDDLWNRNRNVEVEPVAQHGTVAGLLSEVARAGLEVTATEVLRNWGEALVDTCLVAARRAPGRGA